MPNLFSVSLYSSPLSTLQPYYHILSSYPEKNNSKSLRVALICLRFQQFVLQGDTLLLNGKKKKNEDTDALTENKLLELFFFSSQGMLLYHNHNIVEATQTKRNETM